MLSYLYSTASLADDYQDTALLVILWYLFGRVSDLAMLEKKSLTLCLYNVLFIRFQCMKISEDLFIPTIPIGRAHLRRLHVLWLCNRTIHGSFAPLSYLLQDVNVGSSQEVQANNCAEAVDNEPCKSTGGQPGIHAYVNRLLSRIACATKDEQHAILSSHSFRRGGAQHANSKAGVSPHWIADRGCWNMTTTNKLFAYIFNSTQEDLLGGHDSDSVVTVLDLQQFDTVTNDRISTLRDDLFSSCRRLKDENLSVNSAVLDVLFAYFIKTSPQHCSLNATSPLVKRVEKALTRCGIMVEEGCSSRRKNHKKKNVHIIEHQAAVIDQLIKVTTSQAGRLRQLEMKIGVQTSHDMSDLQALPTSVVAPEKTTAKRRKRKMATLSEAWYEWFAGRAYITEEDRQWKSTMRRCVLYMMLFAHELYQADDFRDKFLSVGHELHDKMMKFLARFQMSATSVGTIVKKMRSLHSAGNLNELIVDFNARVLAWLVRDPTPRVHRGQALVPVEASA
ncbi:hypothetical protein LEN26_012827 [Aphanomyces euteiches]|nr:hypothetical protein LEN26_012827 [Aphanomyces euteiches]